MLSVLPDAVVTPIGTPVTIYVLANDTGSALTITSFSNPGHGSVVFNGDQSFTYTPSAGFVGDDSFFYTVRDAQGTPSGAEVTVTVAPDGDVTRAVDDYVEMVTDGQAVIPVLNNDVAAAGPIQLIAISVPGHGAVNVLSDQSIRYVPQSGFVGIDSFTYKIVDAAGTTASASVVVKVLAKNSTPVAKDDAFVVETGQPTVLAVLSNDGDPDGDPLQIVSFTMPVHGRLDVSPDKTFTYTPDADYLGADHFTYTIRDTRGNSDVGNVTLNVVTIAESPTAVDDHATTEAGTPITIDMLANDEPAGDQSISVVAITLPYQGKIVFNADKTITYTPNAGFIGVDDFTYTIGGEAGNTSRARVTVEVTPASAIDTYANGYASRRRIILPAPTTDQTTVDDAVVLFAKEADWLKAVAHGGRVASLDGADLRFELIDGSKLDHEIERYDPLTGELLAWIRLPSWTLSSQLQLIVYYGNPSLTGNEANPTGVWQGYLARWRLPDGSEASGSGRDLTVDNVQSGELLGSAASLDGTGRLELAGTGWLDGLSTLTVQALVRPHANMIGSDGHILAQGEAASPGALALGYRAETETGATNVVYAAVGSADGEAIVFSRTDRQTDDRQLIYARWQSDDAPWLYLDGSPASPSSSQPRSGVTQSGGGPLEIGRDWVGLIDEVRITDRALPTAWIAAEARNMLTPELSYGLGEEETVATTTPPVVAVPFAVRVEAAKWIDIDVLAQIFAPATGEAATIVSIGQPANGSVTVIGSVVRYAPASDFVGKDQFTYTIGNGETHSAGLIVVTVFDPLSGNQGELPPGENLLVNSKLAGSGAIADNWSNRYPGEGAISFSSADIDGHRRVRLVAGSTSDRASIEQLYRVVAGERYVFSVTVAAVDAATDPTRVIMNHAPFSNGSVLGGASARPTLGAASAGERVHYIFDATVTGQLKMIIGLDGAGDITLERPMLDKASALRGYMATDPVAEPEDPTPAIDFDRLPHRGMRIGNNIAVSANMSQAIKGGRYGHRLVVPWDGELAQVQFNITSNRAGETTKSSVNGSQAHGFPASWKLGYRIAAADESWQPTGPLLRDIQFTHERQAADDDRTRQLQQLELAGLPVTAGQRLLLWVYSREADPASNWCAVNYYLNGGRPAFGLQPPRAYSRTYGDAPMSVMSGTQSGTMSPSSRGDLGGLGIRYADGREWGDSGFDASPIDDVFRLLVGEDTRVRQRFSYPHYFKATHLELAAYRRPDQMPQGDLTVRISGSGLTPITLSIPASSIQVFDGQISSSYTHDTQLFELPTPLLGTPDTTYTIEISATSTSKGRYRVHARRRWSAATAPATGVTPIEPDHFDMDAEISFNGGSSWQPASWSGGRAMLPAALVINGQVSKSPLG